jgi:hypothetical protein
VFPPETFEFFPYGIQSGYIAVSVPRLNPHFSAFLFFASPDIGILSPYMGNISLFVELS